MPEKKMWVQWEDGADLSRSRKSPGDYSPLTRDGDKNLGHVTLRDVEEDDDLSTYWTPLYPDGDGRAEADEEDTALGELVGTLAFLGVVVAVHKAAPHVARWWDVTAFPFLRSARNWLFRAPEAGDRAVEASAVVIESDGADSSQVVVGELEQYRQSMSSAEARERLLAALVARIYSDEQLRVLRSVRIEDGPDLAKALESLTPQQLEDGVRAMLEAAPSWADGEALGELAKALGRGGAGDREYVPVRRAQIERALGRPGGEG